MFKRALVSVSDKSGLIEFLRPLAAQGLEVVSTGGTYKHLRESGIPVMDVSELTNFPEVMGGRVKTLHPSIHMSLLARESVSEDYELLEKHHLKPFDLVIVNLYPFEEAFKNRHQLSENEVIEKIDIGGPSMLRSAAKNFSRICVVCDPADYHWIHEKKSLTFEDRKKLAAKVFAHTSTYDSLISKHLDPDWGLEYSMGGKAVMELRYGENPQQKAKWYQQAGMKDGLQSAKIIQGKALSYNNILDLDAALRLCLLFDKPVCVAVKHNNPCGVATGDDVLLAAEKALHSDPVSVFGGIIAINRTVDDTIAKLLSGVFLECVIAPEFTESALSTLSAKKNLRLLQIDFSNLQSPTEVKSILGGFLLQTSDDQWGEIFKKETVSKNLPPAVLQDMLFGEKVCGALKSNAIAIVKNGQTLGLGMGQVNRVEAVQHAIQRMEQHHGVVKDTVLVSDAFFPFADSIEIAAKAHVKYILQPGGSVKDNEVVSAAEKLGVTMILSQVRHFKH